MRKPGPWDRPTPRETPADFQLYKRATLMRAAELLLAHADRLTAPSEDMTWREVYDDRAAELARAIIDELERMQNRDF